MAGAGRCRWPGQHGTSTMRRRTTVVTLFAATTWRTGSRILGSCSVTVPSTTGTSAGRSTSACSPEARVHRTIRHAKPSWIASSASTASGATRQFQALDPARSRSEGGRTACPTLPGKEPTSVFAGTSDGTDVEIAVFDVAGKRIRALMHGRGPVTDRVYWDGSGDDGRPVRPGVYFAQIRVGGHVESVRMVLLK